MKHIFIYIVYAAAFALAGSAAYYSVFGLSKLFSAQAFAVIIMASTLEISKLITASYLHQYWKQIGILLKTYLVTAVLVLMLITSAGIYGFLVSAYQTTSDQLTVLDKQTAVVKLKNNRFREQLSLYQFEKEQLNQSILDLSKGLSNNVIQYKDKEGNIITTTSSLTRKALQSQLSDSKEQRNLSAIKIESLTDSITKLDLLVLDIESNNDASAELGPLRYISDISGYPMNVVVNWFILIFIFVFDPLAITLLIAAQIANKKTDMNKSESLNDPTQIIVDNDQEIELQDDWDNTLMDGLEDNLTQETLSATDIEWLQNAANQEKLNNRSHTKIIS
jgi:hypothetical protein|tara:strand:+ start:209 stop:1213 length:1005 start_codon:yes stop_codon:yes gene_type:complete